MLVNACLTLRTFVSLWPYIFLIVGQWFIYYALSFPLSSICKSLSCIPYHPYYHIFPWMSVNDRHIPYHIHDPIFLLMLVNAGHCVITMILKSSKCFPIVYIPYSLHDPIASTGYVNHYINTMILQSSKGFQWSTYLIISMILDTDVSHRLYLLSHIPKPSWTNYVVLTV